jgi:hypothetical protein
MVGLGLFPAFFGKFITGRVLLIRRKAYEPHADHFRKNHTQLCAEREVRSAIAPPGPEGLLRPDEPDGTRAFPGLLSPRSNQPSFSVAC